MSAKTAQVNRRQRLLALRQLSGDTPIDCGETLALRVQADSSR